MWSATASSAIDAPAVFAWRATPGGVRAETFGRSPSRFRRAVESSRRPRIDRTARPTAPTRPAPPSGPGWLRDSGGDPSRSPSGDWDHGQGPIRLARRTRRGSWFAAAIDKNTLSRARNSHSFALVVDGDLSHHRAGRALRAHELLDRGRPQGWSRRAAARTRRATHTAWRSCCRAGWWSSRAPRTATACTDPPARRRPGRCPPSGRRR